MDSSDFSPGQQLASQLWLDCGAMAETLEEADFQRGATFTEQALVLRRRAREAGFWRHSAAGREGRTRAQ